MGLFRDFLPASGWRRLAKRVQLGAKAGAFSRKAELALGERGEGLTFFETG